MMNELQNVDINEPIFVGSRACEANHYFIAEKCPVCLHLRSRVGHSEHMRSRDRYIFREMS